MKRLLVFSFFTLLFSNVFANHISGGEMIYQYIGPGSTPNTKLYKITLRLFRDNNGGGAAMPTVVRIGIFNNDNNAQINLSPFDISLTSTSQVPVSPPPICMVNPPNLNYSLGVFEFTIDLPNNANGYTAAYQTCCRIFPLQNVLTQNQPAQGEGSTYICTIPGTNQLPAGVNSSPQFGTQLAPVCYRAAFTFDFSAFDPDGDSLVYYYCNAYDRGNSINSNNVTPSNPPYQSVNYINGYSGTNPLGSTSTLNTRTGIISGIAPQTAGRYVVCVCIDEYRNGVVIGHHRKDFILNVNDCNVPAAVLNPRPTTCDGFTVNFENDAPPDNIQSYLWDFGDGNTSTQSAPSHTYLVAGDYTLKLVVNQGLPCSDSATRIVKVYPGFHPDFTITGQCQNVPIQFTDISTADFGIINGWHWNFGDPASLNNTATVPITTHTYNATGTYNIEFIVQSSKGCVDTILRPLDILPQPPISGLRDTLICIIDTLQLNAVGSGSFLWTPNYMISNVNIPDPLVSPDVTTTYTVALTDAFGCTANQSVKINVKNFVTQFGGPDTTICRTDTVILRLTSDALHFLWTENPAGGNTLNDPTLKNPTAKPLVTTSYHVVGNIGKCITENDIRITPIPYPLANAGPDLTICIGNSAQLNASGGSIYSWSPAAFLNATNIPNPQSIKPTDNVRYIVTIRDVLGCPKPAKDTMFLFVSKIKANAGPRDTSVVLDQPLQLGASGSTNYSWTPTTWLNDPFISTPIALPRNDIEYIVRVSNSTGCFDYDSIRVHVFKINPDLYVPNAFTPNADGDNDIFRPIPIGMKSVDIFRVYNRWGQMLYSGTGNGAGWDGKFAGRPQEAATYVWYAEGVDYLDHKLKRKGTVILIR
ncbi:MAG: PKD domain-containing protein [Ferruginibacter sp.]